MWHMPNQKLKELEIRMNWYESILSRIIATSVTPVQYSLEWLRN